MTSTSQERIPKRLIGAIVAVGSLAFIGILTETVMTVLFPELMTEFGVNTATVQWITTVYLLVVAATMPLSSFLNRRFRLKSLFIAAVVLAVTGSAIMIVGAFRLPVVMIGMIEASTTRKPCMPPCKAGGWKPAFLAACWRRPREQATPKP